jgi:hypothetical protein
MFQEGYPAIKDILKGSFNKNSLFFYIDSFRWHKAELTFKVNKAKIYVYIGNMEFFYFYFTVSSGLSSPYLNSSLSGCGQICPPPPPSSSFRWINFLYPRLILVNHFAD